eukprot:NODE_141_length_17903_cov_0.288643.p7 type:complete len:238 gc:universal NODE_141_length_17903_cov_0.288643:2523-1810(-)
MRERTNFLSFSDNRGNYGYFVPDSTIDFCELNYQHSFYVAEFFNALSSLALMYFGAAAFRDTRFKISSALLIFVGIGSMLFHATLKYKMQLLDELPMLWFASWNVYEVAKIRGKNAGILLPIAMGLFGTFLHIYAEFPVLFFLLHTIYQLPVFFFPLTYWQDRKCRRWTLEFVASISLALLLWNLDQIYCDEVKFLHFHSFWHILSGLTMYKWLIMADYIFQNKLVLLKANNKKLQQ